jgi:hypothetical protein
LGLGLGFGQGGEGEAGRVSIEKDSKLRSPAKFITIAVTVQLVSNKKKKEEYKK